MASLHLERWARLALAAALTGTVGCNIFESGGNSGTGRFSIVPAGDLAAGAWLPVAVQDYEIGGSKTADIGFRLRDPALDPTVAKVRSSNSRGELVIDAVADGATTLSFRATADGDALDDDYPLTVRTAESLTLSACADLGVYIRGLDAAIQYQLFAAESKPVKGLGLYPVVVQPAAASLVPESSDADAWVFHVSSQAPDQVELRSTLPGDDGYLAMTMTVVDPSDTYNLQRPSFTNSPHMGGTGTIRIVPTLGDRPVCSRMRKTIQSSTPGICRLMVDGLDHDRIENSVLDTAEVHFVAQGACKIAVTLVDLAVELDLDEVTVLPPVPKSSGSHHDDWDD
jgi:hypothetical protein